MKNASIFTWLAAPVVMALSGAALAQSPSANVLSAVVVTGKSDSQFDEFSFMGRLPDQAGPLWVKVLQTCESGQNDWSDIPPHGTNTRGLKSPAALLDVQPAPAHQHHH
jgi:uncharacterized protein YcnI